MSKKLDRDVLALKRALKALNQSTDRNALVASLNFICDYYVWHPSREIPTHLSPARREP